MKKLIGIIAVVMIMVIGAIKVVDNGSQKKEAFLKKHNLDTMSISEIASHLDSSVNKPKNLNAQITATHLVLADQEEEHTYKLDSDEFYLSIAPYRHQTHPCFDHVPTGCQGEMINTEVDVVVHDQKGEVVYSDTVKTALNGFAGIWLPKNMEGTITVTSGDKVATSNISTYKTDGTCLTTLQLV